MQGRKGKKKTFGSKKTYDLREALHTHYEGTLVQKKAKEGVYIIKQALIHE